MATEKCVVLVTGASSGFGALTVRELARSGHIVFAGIYGNFPSAKEDIANFSRENSVDLRVVDLNVTSEESIKLAVQHIMHSCGHLDTVVHNAGHMGYGPAEAFTPEQFMHMYEINTLGPQRVNRVVLPYMRKAQQGFIVWVSSSSARGAGSPFLAPYFAAKAAMDSLAQSYATELSQWGIDTTIVVPGIFPTGTSHFKTAAQPADSSVLKEYREGAYKGIMELEMEGSSRQAAPNADPLNVARAIRMLVGFPHGKRPFRYSSHDLDTADDGSMEVNAMADKMRRDWLRRIGLEQLLKVRTESK